MSLIENEIPQQGFEVVRDLIGAILKTELENQKALKGITDDINVFIGRISPFHQSEKLMFNVLLDSANYSGSHQKGTHGATLFYIDIFVASKESDNVEGGLSSTLKRDLYLGMVRYILQDTHYNTLGLPPGLIMGAEVQSFENFDNNDNNDSSFVKVSRINYSVKISEDQSLWKGVNIASMYTTLQLDLTNNGYQYIKEII